MKTLGTAVFLAAVFSVFAGEREELLKQFEKENHAAEETFQKAMTTLELAEGAGILRAAAEKQLYRALDHKLRHTASFSERVRILADFYKLSRNIQRVLDTPRRELGSLAGMRISQRVTELLRQQISVLLLDESAERRWRRIADAVLPVDGKRIRLEQGKAEFTAVRNQRETELKITLFPKDVFSLKKRDFAVIRIDTPFAVNSEHSTSYLCELTDGELRICGECGTSY